MKLLLLLTFLLPALTRAQDVPLSANMIIENLPCQNGSAGSLSVFDSGLSLSLQASFTKVESCDTLTSLPVLAVDTCSAALRSPSAPAPVPTVTPSTTTPLVYSYDAGPSIVVRSPSREVKLSRVISGPSTTYSFQEIARFDPRNPPSSNAFVRNGRYKVLAEGGRDIKPFESEFDVQLLQLTKPQNGSSVSGQTPPTLEWTGGEAYGTPLDIRASLIGTSGQVQQIYDITCRIPDGRSGTFTIPAATWAAVPDAFRSAAYASFAITPSPSTATGINVPLPDLEKGLRIDLFYGVSTSVQLNP